MDMNISPEGILRGLVCRKSPYTNEWDSKGTVFLWSGQGLTALVGCGAKPHK